MVAKRIVQSGGRHRAGSEARHLDAAAEGSVGLAA